MPASKRPDDAVVTAWQALLRAHNVLTDELDRDLRAAHDIPLAWYDVLYQLTDVGGSSKMGDLSQALLIGGSRCTRRVDQMEAAGLVERRRNEIDGRVIEVNLTAAGRHVRRRAGATHLAGIRRVLGTHLDADTAAAMATALDAACTDSRQRAAGAD